MAGHDGKGRKLENGGLERRLVTEASGKKCWKAAYRGRVMLKVTYSYGHRFNELRHLQTIDFATNSQTRRFGKAGVCKVPLGKSRKGSLLSLAAS